MHDSVLYLECDAQGSQTLLDQLSESEPYGLSECVASGAPLRETIQPSKKRRLSILPYGHADLEATNLEKAGYIRRLFPALKQEFDITIVDLPPLLRNEAAIHLLREMDQVLVIVEANRTKVEDVAQVVELCGDVEIAGIFINKVTRRLPKWLLSVLGKTS